MYNVFEYNLMGLQLGMGFLEFVDDNFHEFPSQTFWGEDRVNGQVVLSSVGRTRDYESASFLGRRFAV